MIIIDDITSEEQEELQGNIQAWEGAHPDVDCENRLVHPYVAELLEEIEKRRLIELQRQYNPLFNVDWKHKKRIRLS